MGAQAAAQKRPASAGPLGERGRDWPSAQVLALSGYKKRERTTERKAKRPWPGTYAMHSVTVVTAAKHSCLCWKSEDSEYGIRIKCMAATFFSFYRTIIT